MTRFISLFALLICLIFSGLLSAQGIKGLVIDQDGNPLPFATIFITETGSGSISNQKGAYELKLKPGTYKINFQYLGYASEQIKVTIGDEVINRDIVLQKQAYLLGEAEIDGGSEDPAYKIMRKAIAKSSYHRQQVDHYTCEVYLKGGGRLKKVPWFAKKMLEEEGIDTSATFVTESVSEITYTRPGNYEERVISIKTQGDDQNTSPMNYISSSLYEPKVAGFVSPFSTKAFAYYKFKYLRTFADRDRQISEIQVIPRSRGEDVVAGTIYVVEELWCIHSVNLVATIQGIDINIRQVFAPVEENVWMPVSHRYDGEGKILGFGFEFQYLAAVRDYDIEINPDLGTEFTVLDEKTEKEAIESRKAEPPGKKDIKREEAEEKLLSGEDLTRKELRKLMKTYEKIELKKSSEPVVVEERIVTIDSLAHKNDSAYWADKRPVPLTKREEKGYAVQDSLAAEEKKKQEGDTLATGKGKFSIADILFGNTYNLGNDNYLRLHQPLTSLSFNTVDGYNFEYKISYFKRFGKNKRLEIAPTGRYAFARNTIQGKAHIDYQYGSSLKKSSIRLSAGYFYRQFNRFTPIAPFTNTISSLVAKRNFMKIFDQRYIDLYWSFKPAHNLRFTPRLSLIDRTELFNNTDQYWLELGNGVYTPNWPANPNSPETGFGESRAVKLRLDVTYRPGMKYNKRGSSYYPRNNPPTFTLRYEKAIPDVLDGDADYDLVALEVKHRFNLNLFGDISVRTEGGYFLNRKRLDFMDFAHFMGNETIFTRYSQMSGYSIAPFYEFSTNREYLSTYINYEFRQFLFTNIPALRLTGVKENININHLITPSVNNYTEVSYSVDNIFRFFRIDVTTAFIDGQYADFRIQLGITSQFLQFD
ncbi:MAG TPA: DUF5686 and carboxypeptidase regulatory-like domain-containing protein [Cryomorphaceae bacterium]|nr:DUF5686 and carboxypeptidase regulatory-like domain-containing protein [Cryomorphaceae bacterium]